MKISRTSRRMFLQGAAGFALGIPTLTSLLSRPARALAQETAPPVRYVQWITNHGQFEENFWPAAKFAPKDAAKVAGETLSNVKVRPLSEISGVMSKVLGEDFDGLRAKMNVVRGIDLMVSKNYHNSCVPTCGSWPREDNSRPDFAHSVDSILETSAAVYPSPVVLPALRLTPGTPSAYHWGSYCWTTRNGKPFRLPCHERTAGAIQALFGNEGNQQASAAFSQLKLTDQVLDDYKAVSGSTAISVTDRELLTNYMDLLADVQARMEVETVACMAPEMAKEDNFNILHQNACDLAVAAMACGATRVVAYHCYQGSPTRYDEQTFHGWAHGEPGLHGQMMVWRYKQLARLLNTMDAFVEPDGNTLLDNSMVYANNELSVPGHGSGHLQDMPIVTAGSAGGRLVTGQYIDFGVQLLNNLLITAFHVMGVGPDEYEKNDRVGFGDYVGKFPNRYNALAEEGKRRLPLPYLYRG